MRLLRVGKDKGDLCLTPLTLSESLPLSFLPGFFTESLIYAWPMGFSFLGRCLYAREKEGKGKSRVE